MATNSHRNHNANPVAPSANNRCIASLTIHAQASNLSSFTYTPPISSISLQISCCHSTSFVRYARNDRFLSFESFHCLSVSIRSEEHTSELQSRENLVCR